MKTIAQLTYDNYEINRFSEEGKQLKRKLSKMYPLNGNSNNVMPEFSISTNEYVTIKGGGLINSPSVTIDTLGVHFSKANNSYLELDPYMFTDKGFKISLDIRFDDISETSPLISLTNIDGDDVFSLYVNHLSKSFSIKGIAANVYNCVPVREDSVWQASGIGSIIEKRIYAVDLIYTEGAVLVYINGNLDKVLFIPIGDKIARARIGEKINATSHYIEIYKINNELTSDLIANSEEITYEQYAISFDFEPNATPNQTLFSTSLINIRYENGTMIFNNGSNTLTATGLVDGKTYSFIISNGREAIVSIHDKESGTEVIRGLFTPIAKHVNGIITASSLYIKKLCIYETILTEEERNILSHNHFSIKDGVLDFALNETSLFYSMAPINGEVYKIPLTDKYSSIYSDFTYVDSCMKSGTSSIPNINKTENISYCDKISDTNNLPLWNSALHSDAYQPLKWSNGYVVEDPNKTVGMFAKWTREGKTPNDLCLRFAPCQENYKRAIASKTVVLKNELLGAIDSNNAFTISMLLKADDNCGANISFLDDTGKSLIGKSISILKGDWNTYNVNMVASAEMLTKDTCYLSIEVLNNEANIWIQDVLLSKGIVEESTGSLLAASKVSSINIGSDYLITTSSDWQLCYQAKGFCSDFTDTIGTIKYGIDKGNIFIENATGRNIIGSAERGSWIQIVITKNSSGLRFMFNTKSGTFKATLSDNPSLLLTFASIGCGLYKKLIVVKNGLIEEDKLSKVFYTKMSYKQTGMLLANVNVNERN